MDTKKNHRRKKGKVAVCLMLSALLLQLLGGCAGTGDGSNEMSVNGKTKVTIALWGDQLLENYAPWLQEQFPDVEFDFYSATNSTDYYNYLAENDELPDIMTVRRFSLNDVEGLKDQLMDLSDTDVANSYYQSYLRSYTYADGTVNWLPASAEVDDIIINRTLFEEYDIEIPTDYESFLAACEAFEAVGITPLETDIDMDYRCMEMLQGFSAAALSSAEGMQWRQDYESGATNQLSEEVWLSAFEKMLEVIEATGMDEDSLECTSVTVGEDFTNGEVAMYCGGTTYAALWGGDYEELILPYPGDTEEESYYLTYPVFQAAAKATDDPEREALILEILEAMLSEDGLNHIIPGESMVGYNKNVTMNLDEEYSYLEPYVEENRMYIRLASTDMFSVSSAVVHQMLSGEITDAQTAFDTFNQLLLENETAAEAETVAQIDTGYSRVFTKEHGNQAASAVYNTLREELGADCLIGSSASVGCDVREGDYTEKELGYLLNWEGSDVRQMELTGAELKDYVEFYLNVKETRDSVCNVYTLPVASGFEMTISESEDGYQVEALTINGEAIDEDQTYTVVSWDTYSTNYNGLLESAGFTEYETLDAGMDALIYDRLVTQGGQLSEPTDYITLE